MKYILFYSVMALSMGLATSVMARPVSYPEGWTVMQMNDADSHNLHIHYSPTARYSIGYKQEYWRDKDWNLIAGQLNYLMKRWNNRGSQANIYLKSGLGIAYSDYGTFDGKVEPAAFTGIAADWEDRRWFTSYENRVNYAGDIDRSFTQKARIGVAPYIGNFGDLHTWLMLQVDHAPENQHQLTFTPMVRLFQDVTMVEAGISNHGDVMLNWVVRF